MNFVPRHLKIVIKRASYSVAAALTLVLFPAPNYYSLASAQENDCHPVQPVSSGVIQPTGAAAKTYTYNKCTGLWENAHYTFNPATQQYTALDAPVYIYNQSTWMWQNTNHWSYTTSSNSYFRDTVNSSPPGGVSNGEACSPPQTPNPAPQSLTASTSSPASGTSATNKSNTNSITSDSTNVTLNTNINSDANSGSVIVNANTVSGNAISGATSVSADVINSVNTYSGIGVGDAITFTKNINGDVNGDLIINPSQLQPSNIDLQRSNNVTLTSQYAGRINNNIDLVAKSGDVTTSRNTAVGDATSGSAKAMANVVNMLNSYVGADQSFIGTINIYGNLRGNILMPPKFYTDLVASGAPHTAVDLNQANLTDINDLSTTEINNQINSQARSGTVTLSKNTKAGNATSGSASTAVEIYNLTGRQIVGQNCLLVFVNVTGKWVGVIVNAPTGSHTAALGGNITANSSNNLVINSTSKNSINNLITARAISGNVTSEENTSAGNATSGDAATSVNLANLSGDNISLSGWFGVLFINVFGTWYGNFGMIQLHTSSSGSGNRAGNYSSDTHAPAAFRFASSINGSGVGFGSSSGSAAANTKNNIRPVSANLGNVLVATTNTANRQTDSPDRKNIGGDGFKWSVIIGSLTIAALLYLLSSRPSSVNKYR